VVEACANAGWVHDLAVAAGHTVRVANTAAAAWTFQHLKRKTDKDDALRLAEREAIGQLPTVAVPDPATRQRRMLIAYRQELVGRRVACQNRIRVLFAGQGLATPRGAAAGAAAGLAGIEQQAQPLADCGPAELWRGLLALAVAEYRALAARITEAEARLDALADADPATRLLETIPGVGPRTAEAVATHLGDQPAGSPPPSRSGRTPGWSPGSTSPGSPTGGGGSPAAGRASSASSWSSAPGACCGPTRGRGPCTPGCGP
jgi:transposase